MIYGKTILYVITIKCNAVIIHSRSTSEIRMGRTLVALSVAAAEIVNFAAGLSLGFSINPVSPGNLFPIIDHLITKPNHGPVVVPVMQID